MPIIVLMALLVLMVSIPFIHLPIYRNAMNRKTKTMLSELRKTAHGQKLSLSAEEVLRNGVIGLDGLERKLIYVETGKMPMEFVLVSLDEVESCSLNVDYRNIGAGDLEYKNVEDFIDKVYLRLVFHDGTPYADIPFYDCRNNYVFELADLRKKAQQWKKIISQLLETSIV